MLTEPHRQPEAHEPEGQRFSAICRLAAPKPSEGEAMEGNWQPFQGVGSAGRVAVAWKPGPLQTRSMEASHHTAPHFATSHFQVFFFLSVI